MGFWLPTFHIKRGLNMSTIQKMIAYYGRQNSGKTTTLNMVIETLKAHSNYTYLETIHYPDSRTDLEQIAIFKHIESEKIIGIATAGDYQEITQFNCDIFLDKKVNIALLATRTKNQTVNTLSAFVKNYEVKKLWWIGASYPTSHTITNLLKDKEQLEDYNKTMATTLLNAIEIEL